MNADKLSVTDWRDARDAVAQTIAAHREVIKQGGVIIRSIGLPTLEELDGAERLLDAGLIDLAEIFPPKRRPPASDEA